MADPALRVCGGAAAATYIQLAKCKGRGYLEQFHLHIYLLYKIQKHIELKDTLNILFHAIHRKPLLMRR